MERMELMRSEKALQLQIRGILAAAVVTALLAGLMMRVIIHWALDTYIFAGLLTFLVIMAIAWLAVMIRQKKWNDEHYYLGPDALTVISTKGLLGTKEDVYLYESIISASFTQGYVAKRYGYGDMNVMIPKLDGQPQLVLKDIINPTQQLPVLKARIKSKSGNRRELVT